MDNLTTAIKTKENFNDYQIALIQTAALIGFYMTFFSGLMYDRLGAILTISFGFVLVLLGYTIMFLSSFIESSVSFLLHSPSTQLIKMKLDNNMGIYSNETNTKKIIPNN
jgi:fucose permease